MLKSNVTLYGPTPIRRGKKLTGQNRYELLDLSDPSDPDGEWLGEITVNDKALAFQIAERMGWDTELN